MSGMQFPPPIDPEDPGRGPLVMGVNYTFTILAVLAVALRFYVRKKVGNKRWGWDEWLMLAAVIFQVVCECLFAVSFHYGFGKHDYSIQKPDQFVMIMKWAWIAQGVGQVTSILARLSITISLVVIFGVHTWFKNYLIVLTTIQSCLGIVMLVLSYTQVRPIEGLWNVFLPDVWRLNPNVFIYTGYLTQSIYTLADVSYVLIPVIIIWRLNMALQQRIGLICLLAVMLVTAAMSILKTYNIGWQGDASVTDPLYRNTLQVLYANLEQTNVIIMGCVPTLRGIVRVKLPSSLSRVSQSLASLLGRTNHTSTGSTSLSRHPDAKLSSLSGTSGQSFGTYHNLDEETNPWSSRRDYHSRGDSGAHHDLEMSTSKLGSPINSAAVARAYSEANNDPFGPYGGSEIIEQPEGTNHVRRTDHFSVSYDVQGKP